MTIAQDHIYAVKVNYAISGNRLSTTIHYSADQNPLNGMTMDLLTAFNTTVMPLWKAMVTAECRFQSIYVRCMDRYRIWPAELPFGTNIGTYTGESLPSNIAMIIQLRQGEVSGRTNNRVYIAGVSEDVVNGSQLDGAFLTAVVGPFQVQLQTGTLVGSLANYTCCAVHKTAPGPHPTYEGHPLIQTFADASLGTQRRRTTELRQFHP